MRKQNSWRYLSFLNVDCDYSGQTFKHILVPIWLLNYYYGARNFQVVINGVSGSIGGEYPKSWIKIAFLILAILVLIGLFFLIANH